MRGRTLPLWLHALPLTAAFMLPNLVTPLMELLRDEIGFSSGVLTVVFVAYLGGLAPAFLLAPGVATACGRRRTQMMALAAGILSCVLYACADAVPLLIAARILTGACSGIVLVLGPGAVQAVAGAEEGRTATLVATMGIAVGLAGGPLFAGAVAQLLPWPTTLVFVLMAALLLAAIPVVATEPETPRGPVDSWLPFAGLDGRAARAIVAGLGAFGPGMTAAAIILALSPTLLKGLDGPEGPLAAGLVAGGMYVASPVAQACVRRMGSLPHIRLSLALTATAMAVFAAAVLGRDIGLLIAGACLMGAGQGIGNLGSFGLLHQRLATHQVAGATAVLSLGVYACASVVPLVGGVLLDRVGLGTAGAAMAAGVILMVAAGAAFAREGFVAAGGPGAGGG